MPVEPFVASFLAAKLAIAKEYFPSQVALCSHAPLEEFWQRVRRPKLCISLPCCSDFGARPMQTPKSCLRLRPSLSRSLNVPRAPRDVHTVLLYRRASAASIVHRPLVAFSLASSRCTRTWTTRCSPRRREFTCGTKSDFSAACVRTPHSQPLLKVCGGGGACQCAARAPRPGPTGLVRRRPRAGSGGASGVLTGRPAVTVAQRAAHGGRMMRHSRWAVS
jgi:hypothetical protein